jgi:transposase-like protein
MRKNIFVVKVKIYIHIRYHTFKYSKYKNSKIWDLVKIKIHAKYTVFTIL